MFNNGKSLRAVAVIAIQGSFSNLVRLIKVIFAHGRYRVGELLGVACKIHRFRATLCTASISNIMRVNRKRTNKIIEHPGSINSAIVFPLMNHDTVYHVGVMKSFA